MRTVRLLIAFQGTHYDGWQSQRNNKTLQELFEKHLSRILKEKTVLHGSSRTDSGVHAKGFCAHFKTRNSLSEDKIKDALNYYLPRDIVVLSAKKAPDSFHARFDAKHKTYQYEIWNHRTRPAYDKAPFVLWVTQKLDVSKMQKAAKYLVGRHDFNAFRDSGDEERKTVKRIKSISVRKDGPSILIRVTADGFLKHMVRVIAGTLIEVGRHKITQQGILNILLSKDRRQAGPTAKSLGLTLIRVQY